MNIFSMKLNELMELKNVKNVDLAKAIGVSAPAVSSWVNGKKVPELLKVKKISDFFDVHFSYFFEDGTSTDNNDCISLNDLSEEQISLIKFLIDSFREKNNG